MRDPDKGLLFSDSNGTGLYLHECLLHVLRYLLHTCQKTCYPVMTHFAGELSRVQHPVMFQ